MLKLSKKWMRGVVESKDTPFLSKILCEYSKKVSVHLECFDDQQNVVLAVSLLDADRGTVRFFLSFLVFCLQLSAKVGTQF